MWAFGHVGKAERSPVAEQDSEHAVVTGQVSDPGSRRLVDSRGDEPLQTRPGAVQHAQGRAATSRAAVSTVCWSTSSSELSEPIATNPSASRRTRCSRSAIPVTASAIRLSHPPAVCCPVQVRHGKAPDHGSRRRAADGRLQLSRPDGPIQRSDNARRQFRRAAAVDQLDHGVEIDPAVAREAARQVGTEARGKQPTSAPVDDLGRQLASAAHGLMRSHGSLASSPPGSLPCLRRHALDLRPRPS